MATIISTRVKPAAEVLVLVCRSLADTEHERLLVKKNVVRKKYAKGITFKLGKAANNAVSQVRTFQFVVFEFHHVRIDAVAVQQSRGQENQKLTAFLRTLL